MPRHGAGKRQAPLYQSGGSTSLASMRHHGGGKRQAAWHQSGGRSKAQKVRSGGRSVAASAASSSNPEVVDSAACASDDFHRFYDEANMQDMMVQDRAVVVQSRRCIKLGKAYQNYRRAQMRRLDQMPLKKTVFVIWKRLAQGTVSEMCMEDMIWTEDDMDHFLHTECSFQAHKEYHYETEEKRKDPNHKDYSKPMPRMLPPSYVRDFQLSLSQEHSAKFRQHFGAASIDGTLHAPLALMPGFARGMVASAVSVPGVVASASTVAESAARATQFQQRVFMADTRLAIDSKTSFLDRDEAKGLVKKVQNYRGTKLETLLMKRVKQIATAQYGKNKRLSPVQLRIGYAQILGAALKRRWQRAEMGEEPRRKRRRRESQQEEWEVPQEEEEAAQEEEPQEMEEAAQEEEPQEEEEAAEEEEPQEEEKDDDFSPDWGPVEPEAAGRPAPTDQPELDEALAELLPNVVESSISHLLVPFQLNLQDISQDVIETADAAFISISTYRKDVIHPRIKFLMNWLQHNMKNFRTRSVAVFGSKSFHLELSSSDVNVAVVLGPGESSQTWLKQLQQRTMVSDAFQLSKKHFLADCLHTVYMGVPVTMKAIRNTRTSDGACRMSDCLRYMVEWRMWKDPSFLYLKFRAILIFRLLCHHLHVTQDPWRARTGNFKAMALCYWAVLMLDDFDGEGKQLDHFLYILCHMFLSFDWKRSKVVVSAAGHASIQAKDLKAAVCIMLDDGKVNSTQNVTGPHLEHSKRAIEGAIPNLEVVIAEACAKEIADIEARKIEIDAQVDASVAQVAASAARVSGLAASPKWMPAPPTSRPRQSLLDLKAGSFAFGKHMGVIVAPPRGTNHDSAPIIILMSPTDGFSQKEQDGDIDVPMNCPTPCWYAYMQWSKGGWKAKLPDELLQFVQFIHSRAKNRGIFGWGISRGAKWLIELTREHQLLDAAVMFAGYPQTRCQHEQVANAQELIEVRNCAICMVHFVADECCGVTCFPHWHAEFERHMAKVADPEWHAEFDRHVANVAESAAEVAGSVAIQPVSSLISLILLGNHKSGYDIWHSWDVECDPTFSKWFMLTMHMLANHPNVRF